MSGRRKNQRWGMPKDRREPMGARVALLLILVNCFLWIGLRNVDMLVVSLVSLPIALAGLIIAFKTGKKIQRHGGRLSGENMANIGYWGNLLLFVGALFLFCYMLAVGVMRGELL